VIKEQIANQLTKVDETLVEKLLDGLIVKIPNLKSAIMSKITQLKVESKLPYWATAIVNDLVNQAVLRFVHSIFHVLLRNVSDLYIPPGQKWYRI